MCDACVTWPPCDVCTVLWVLFASLAGWRSCCLSVSTWPPNKAVLPQRQWLRRQLLLTYCMSALTYVWLLRIRTLYRYIMLYRYLKKWNAFLSFFFFNNSSTFSLTAVWALLRARMQLCILHLSSSGSRISVRGWRCDRWGRGSDWTSLRRKQIYCRLIHCILDGPREQCPSLDMAS